MRKIRWLWLLGGILTLQVTAEAASQYDRLGELSARIIGGEKSSENNWPFMAALVRTNAIDTFQGQFCGATYIGQGFVLTAAHCIASKRITDFYVHIGIHDLSKANTQGQVAQVRAIYIHPAYNHVSYANDIALIEVTSQPNRATVKLATEYKNTEMPAHTELIAMGWGEQSPDKIGIYPKVLYQVTLPYVLRSSCQNLGGNYNNVTENALCAGFIDGGKDACQGDSGGPLIYQRESIIKQVGIVSWGDSCAKPNAYGVYTNVSYFDDWIQATIERSSRVSSSGGSIGWSLLGLGLLGWFRFRKGVRL